MEEPYRIPLSPGSLPDSDSANAGSSKQVCSSGPFPRRSSADYGNGRIRSAAEPESFPFPFQHGSSADDGGSDAVDSALHRSSANSASPHMSSVRRNGGSTPQRSSADNGGNTEQKVRIASSPRSSSAHNDGSSTRQTSSADNGDNTEQKFRITPSPRSSSAHNDGSDAADSTPQRSSADNGGNSEQQAQISPRSSAHNSGIDAADSTPQRFSADNGGNSEQQNQIGPSPHHNGGSNAAGNGGNNDQQVQISPFPHLSSPNNGGSSKRAWQHIQIFSTNVLLPPDSCIWNSVGKLIEVDTRGYQFSQQELDKIRQDHYPQLLVEWVEKTTLCFQMPSSSATDTASKFEGQIHAYLKRYHKASQVDTRPSSSLFKATAPHSYGENICADLTIFELTGYEQKLNAAKAQGRTIPYDVQVYATVEVQSESQSEEYIRDACKKEARLMDCIAIAVLVKTGWIEIYSSTQRLYANFNPRYVDVGSHCSTLDGLRLYLEPLRHAKGWSYPRHPSSYCHEENDGGALPALIMAIQVGDFVLAENIVNYIDSLKEDERPLLEAVKQATLQIPPPHAHTFVEYLLKNGARPSIDMQSISAILIANAAKSQGMINLLSQYGAPAPDIGSDILVAAVRKGDVDFVTLLLQAGADPNRASSSGQLALVEAVPSMAMVEAIVITAGHVEFEKKDFGGLSVLTRTTRLPEIRQFLRSKIQERRGAVGGSGQGRGAAGGTGRGRGAGRGRGRGAVGGSGRRRGAGRGSGRGRRYSR